ncbi:hypothetical protein [Flavisphingomonas formosensis]|uniref:hypothetical protein n=1 Tax=Flavisphingomonas formosensis TaxID=861534 RepID=UPI0012F70D67|nr:hypothetical protein [Sphingomonas formosensis]
MSSHLLQTQTRFYRRWSSLAAELALIEIEPRAKQRCAHSARMWALIAETVEAGDDTGFAKLTNNVICLAQEHMVADA